MRRHSIALSRLGSEFNRISEEIGKFLAQSRMRAYFLPATRCRFSV